VAGARRHPPFHEEPTLFQLRVDDNFVLSRIIFDMQKVWLAADLAIFDVRLTVPG